MRITITTEIGEIHLLEVDSQMELENIKALIEAETGTLINNQILSYHGVELTDPKKTLEQYKVNQDDMLLLKKRNTGTQTTASTIPLEAELFRQMILNQPQMIQQLRETQPELADAALNDRERFATLFQQMEQRRREGERQRMQQIDMLNANPLEVEAQRRIEEAIRMENVKVNFETALEHNPEFLGQVNEHPVKAFVDSGAQGTIMSHNCAEKCGIMRLLDRRFSGVAKGVGTAKILGRVHTCPIRIGKSLFLPCSFTIMEEHDVDLLFGLDMLKRHQAIIDLKQNALIINGEAISFLPEHELPERAQINPLGINSSQPSSASSQIQTYPEEHIKKIMSMSTITRDKAIELLNAADGNLEIALNLLFE
ncbi:4670_t:CDS:10 [Entrophospora sp. SA101]|nr:9914_t:CDS:10 [Entrophospora sp. SA101]CAJ0644948.1 4670_t:CDS:10 [Entrophospora sp. SA101]CAJ0825157.1 5101_t:CDS:10 [Entrophospora sp. SA101]CAJ0829987.1 4456_t:CDS:10 [Entrophospora sp. SA101]